MSYLVFQLIHLVERVQASFPASVLVSVYVSIGRNTEVVFGNEPKDCTVV